MENTASPFHSSRTLRLLAATLLLVAGTVPAQTDGYAAASARADADEAALDNAGKQQLETARLQLLKQMGPGCATNSTDTSSFALVMELDAEGRIVHAWRVGESPLAVCFQKSAVNRTLMPPPRAPFFASLKMNFSAGTQ